MAMKHLSAGDPAPQFSGKIRIYAMRFCPFAHRVMLVLNAKSIEHDVSFINLDSKPEWFLSKSPLGKVPALEVENGVSIYDSRIIAEYLDEKFPQNQLRHSNPLKCAQDKILVENFNGVPVCFFTATMKPDEITDELVDNYFKSYNFVESELRNRATRFLFGKQPGLVDFLLWPWVERIHCLSFIRGKRFECSKENYPLIHSWAEHMTNQEPVKKYFVESQSHTKFLHTKINGCSDFDMLFKI